MTSAPDVRIGRLVIHGRSMKPDEARHFGRLMAEELARLTANGATTSVTVARLELAAEATGDTAIGRLAERVAGGLYRRLL